ncbi:RNA polymerase sigma factor [Posidoniimonas polymericola]|uniref:RNA polymerase sigma factor n=1 Tax=Posidoniimonas polymericola TaxID=2528002 RepID=A0A5C5YUH9_9BACT|nr:sigma-70 family RNA polymerase sigma factor [Posidoniimonas polymericola]TWT78490.1 RNA polymerase sigma factor [Posidoniimonas polymericola]
MESPKDGSQEPPLKQDRTAEFVALYSENYQRLQYFLLALLPTSNDASDVLQETSLVLWDKFETFQSGTNFFAWACKIARLQSLKHHERNRRGVSLFDDETLEKLAHDAEEYASGPEPRMEVLESCLKDLPESDRTLIRRRYETGASVNKIAEEIGVTANRLSKSLGRIRRALMACLERKLANDF